MSFIITVCNTRSTVTKSMQLKVTETSLVTLVKALERGNLNELVDIFFQDILSYPAPVTMNIPPLFETGIHDED